MGSWPPSKPFRATPVRAFWPFMPLPEVLPFPEPMPRPRRLDFFRAPGLSRSSLSFISPTLPRGSLVHLHQVGDPPDHAADGGRVLQLPRAVHLVEAEPDQRRPLVAPAADGRPDLGHPHGLPGLVRHRSPPPPRAPRPCPPDRKSVV